MKLSLRFILPLLVVLFLLLLIFLVGVIFFWSKDRYYLYGNVGSSEEYQASACYQPQYQDLNKLKVKISELNLSLSREEIQSLANQRPPLNGLPPKIFNEFCMSLNIKVDKKNKISCASSLNVSTSDIQGAIPKKPYFEIASIQCFKQVQCAVTQKQHRLFHEKLNANHLTIAREEDLPAHCIRHVDGEKVYYTYFDLDTYR